MGDLARVWSGGDAMQAELLRLRLETEGISVVLKGEGEGPYRAGPVYLWVHRADEVVARTVIDAALSGAFALEKDEAPDGLGAGR